MKTNHSISTHVAKLARLTLTTLALFCWMAVSNSPDSALKAIPMFSGELLQTIIVNPPTLTPVYGPTCSSGWYRINGYNGQYAYLTLNTNQQSQSTNSAIWRPNISQSGTYKVEAWIPTHSPVTWPCPPGTTINWDSLDARYTVHHSGGQQTVAKNQSQIFNAWITVGNFHFNNGTTGYVKLTDLNGETNLSHTISFSALRFTLISADPDTTPPTGSITSPTEGTNIGPGIVGVSANATDNSGGSGVDRVEFWARYNGQWHSIESDSNSPYSASWPTPSGLDSQTVQFAIDIYDNAGNATYRAGGVRNVYFKISTGNPTVTENWIDANRRAYLNQRSLTPSGDLKCGFASVAMLLAMNGQIPRTYADMKNAANGLWNTYDGFAYLWNLTRGLSSYGMTANYYSLNQNDAWNKIKSEINAGYPIIILSSHVIPSGGTAHYFVVVGYQEQGNSRKIIVYDPYGKWNGSTNNTNYDRNSTSAESTKGKWVYYNFDQAWGYMSATVGRLITSRPSTYENQEAIVLLDPPSSPPDIISDEPEDWVIYEGIDVTVETFLPFLLR